MARLSEIKGAAREIEGKAVLAVRHPTDWFPVFIDLKSISDFRIIIAITIPIKNYSGKIADRFNMEMSSKFPFCVPVAAGIMSVFMVNSISDFRIKTDQRFLF